MENIIIILIIAFLAFEFVEHLAFPLIWSLFHRKKKYSDAPGRILREVGSTSELEPQALIARYLAALKNRNSIGT
jgi:hypothetical protein